MTTPLDDFGFALWLTLDAQDEGRLVPIVHALAQRFAGPRFLPHMTVRGRIPGEDAANALLDVHPPMVLHFAWRKLWRIRGEVPAWTRITRVPLAADSGLSQPR
jgi:hypothetical protein